MPHRMTRPRSAPSRTDTARMPGVGGTMEWVRFRGRMVMEAIRPMGLCWRLPMMAHRGLISTMVTSPKTGMDMM